MRTLKSIYRRTRFIVRQMVGLEPRIKTELAVQTEFVGNSYGGWAVCPHAVDEGGLVLSFGVGRDISFDLEMIERFGVQLHAFDPTPRSVAWIETQEVDSSFFFHPIGISDVNGTDQMYPPDDPEHVSYSTAERTGAPVEMDVARLEEICKKLDIDADISILKMDVEGTEYDVIADIIAGSFRPYQLLVEFHHWMPEFEPDDTETAVHLLREAGYRVGHISESGREYTLLHTAVL